MSPGGVAVGPGLDHQLVRPDLGRASRSPTIRRCRCGQGAGRRRPRRPGAAPPWPARTSWPSLKMLAVTGTARPRPLWPAGREASRAARPAPRCGRGSEVHQAATLDGTASVATAAATPGRGGCGRRQSSPPHAIGRRGGTWRSPNKSAASWLSRVQRQSGTSAAGLVRWPKMKAFRSFTVRARLPEPLAPLQELAFNLRWSWDDRTRDLFRWVDPHLWERTHHDPVRVLSPGRPGAARSAGRRTTPSWPSWARSTPTCAAT